MAVQLNGPVDHNFDEPLGLLSDCHRRIEHFLNVMLRVVEAYGTAPLSNDAYGALVAARRYFADAAPRHTGDEEESLFPRMRKAAEAQHADCSVLDRLESDHVEADALHDRVREQIDDWISTRRSLQPEEAETLRNDLLRLKRLYTEHIRIEDEEVFPLAGRLLSNDEIARIGEEMQQRRGLDAAV